MINMAYVWTFSFFSGEEKFLYIKQEWNDTLEFSVYMC